MQDPKNPQKGTYKPLFVPKALEEAQAAKTAQGAQNDDFTPLYTKWAEENERNGGKYLQGRGISIETQRRFKVGFVPSWKHPKNEAEGGGSFSPRCIIPTSKESYLARATDPAETWRAPKVGHAHTFNMKAVSRAAKDTRPVYIVEGENGLYISYPFPFHPTTGEDGQPRSSVFPITKALRDHVEAVVLEKYQYTINNEKVANK